MKTKLTSKKKIILAISLLAIVLLGAVISIVLVFAASNQDIETDISVAYSAEGVGAKVKANYSMIPRNLSAEIEKTSMTTENGNDEIIFNLSTKESIQEIAPRQEEIILNTQTQQVAFEYIFENLADSAFSLELTNIPSAVNMETLYLVSNEQLAPQSYRTKINDSELAPQALTSFGQKIYVYVLVGVINESRVASYEGNFVWEMKAQNTININLNNGGSLSTLKVIPNTIEGLENIAMPCIDVESASGTSAFIGYYTEANGGGIQYINQFGTSSHIADLAAGTTLYAYTDTIMTISDGTMTLTDAGKKLTEVVVPDSVTEIGENTFKDNTTVESVVVSNTVTTIADNAFEGCTNLTSVAYSDGTSIAYASAAVALESIGNYAFKNCINLATVRIPASVTQIGIGAFEGCEKLNNVYFENEWYWAAIDSNGTTQSLTNIESGIVVAKLLKASYSTLKLEYKDISYPQTYVGDTLNETLKTAYATGSSELIVTGRTYTLDPNISEEVCLEYKYAGVRYARLAEAIPFDENRNFLIASGGGLIISGEEYWFKVEPILFDNFTLSDGTKIKLTKMVLANGMYDNNQNNNWATSDLKSYLNETFAQESGIANIAKDYTQYSTIYSNYDTIEENGSETTDKLWIPDCEQIQDFYGGGGTSSNVDIRKVATDFALATYSFNSGYKKELNGNQEYSTIYWLRSAQYETSIYVYRVYLSGAVGETHCRGKYGICFAFAY